MKFPYTKIPSRDSRRAWVSRLFAPVKIFGPAGSIIVDALVDSGADSCVFEASIGQAVGVVQSEDVPTLFRGIGGRHLKGWAHTVRVQIVGAEESQEILVGFAEGLGVSAILGQEGFFDRYKIIFERNKNRFELVPIRD